VRAPTLPGPPQSAAGNPVARMHSEAAGRSRGFALLEVTIALVIALLALGALFHGALGGLRAARVATRTEEAVALARSRLAIAEAAPVPGLHEGDEGSGFRWRVQVRPDGVARRPTGGLGGPPGPDALVTLYDITVWISWPDGETSREVRLDSAKLVTTTAKPP